MWFVWTSLFTLLFAGTLAVPQGFRVNQTYPTKVQLLWDASPDALYYELTINETSTGTRGTTLTLPGGSTEYTVTHLKPYTEYTFDLEYMGLFGPVAKETVTKTTCPGVADSVTNVKASALTATSLSVEWKDPANYHGPKGSTKVHLWAPNGMEKNSADTSPATFLGLQSSLSYYISLMAKTEPDNQCGGGYGEEVLAGLVYLESEEKPITPPKVTLTVSGSTGLRAEWTQTESTDPQILAYTYKLTEKPSGRLERFSHLPVTARSLALNKLTPNTEYELEVSANGLYTHGIAHVSAATAPGVPGSVGNLTATMTGSSLEAKWVAPAYAPGEVSKYQCVLYTGSFPTKTETATQTTHTFQGLDTNSIYRVGVSAIIAPNDQHLGGGMGPESLSDFVGSPVAVPEPEAPTGLKAEVVGPNAIKLTWTAPSNVLVYYYKVIITDKEGVSRTEVAAGSDVLRLLTGLKPNTEYNIVMRAASMEKESGDSQPATATTAHGAPSAPQNIKATLEKPTEVKVVWTKPKYESTGVTKYDVTVRNGGDVVTGANVVVAGTSCVVSNLPAHAELVFAVTATSTQGTGEAGLSNPVYTQATVEVPKISRGVPHFVRVSA